MPNPEVLGLDPERLARSADAHRGYARALEARDAADLLPSIAGNRLVAAVHRCLADSEVARAELREAAYAYQRLGSPYAAVLAVCAGDSELVERSFAAVGSRKPGAIERVARVLAAEWMEYAFIEFEPAGEEADESLSLRMALAPSGRTGTPVRMYTQAFAEAQHPFGKGRPQRDAEASQHPRPLPALAALLERAAEPVFAAMGDRHHWVRLYSTALPVEPEVVGACRCVLRAWTRAGRPVPGLLKRVEGYVHPVALMPLRVAIELEEPGPGQGSPGNSSTVVAPGPTASRSPSEKSDGGAGLVFGEGLRNEVEGARNDDVNLVDGWSWEVGFGRVDEHGQGEASASA